MQKLNWEESTEILILLEEDSESWRNSACIVNNREHCKTDQHVLVYAGAGDIRILTLVSVGHVEHHFYLFYFATFKSIIWTHLLSRQNINSDTNSL